MGSIHGGYLLVAGLKCFLPANHASFLKAFGGCNCGIGDGGPEPPRLSIVAVIASGGAIAAPEFGGRANMDAGGGAGRLSAVSRAAGTCVVIGMGTGPTRPARSPRGFSDTPEGRTVGLAKPCLLISFRRLDISVWPANVS